MIDSVYKKSHSTSIELVNHLKERGLIIKRPNVAARKIDLIGYERLRIYFLSRRDLTQTNHPFFKGVTYNNIINIYKCDSLIRNECFDAVGQFEILFRNSMSEVLSYRYGSHPYDNRHIFRNARNHIKAIQTFLNVYDSLKDQRLKHYHDKYKYPYLPPIWTIKELLTFGKSFSIFKNLNKNLRTEIGKNFGISEDDVLISWIKSFVDLRNICAHHDRLFNKNFTNQPKRFKKVSCPSAPPTKLKAILQCLDYLLNKRMELSNNNIKEIDTVEKVEKIIKRYKEVKLDEAGY